MASAISAKIANDKRDKKDQDGQKMNNIGGTNIIILKQLIVEEANNNFKSYIYLVTTATKLSKFKNKP